MKLPPSRLPRMLGLLCAGTWVACSRSVSPPATEEFSAPPQGLVAEIVFARPAQTWARLCLAGKVQRLCGSADPPGAAALAIARRLGVPDAWSDDLDLSQPATAVLARVDSGVTAALAVHLRSVDRFASLSERARTQATGVALYSDELVLELGSRAPGSLGSYAAARRRARAHAPGDTEIAIEIARPGASAIADTCAALWKSWRAAREREELSMREKHGASSPLIGDPLEALGDLDARVGRALAAARDLERVRIGVALDDASALVRVELTAEVAPSSPLARAVASWQTGDAAPWLGLPSPPLAAILSRDSKPARLEGSREQAEALVRIIGEAIEPADRERVQSLLAAWASARGDWMTAGLLGPESSPIAFARAAADDPRAAEDTVPKLLGLLAIPAIAEPIATWLGPLSFDSIRPVGPLGRATNGAAHGRHGPPKLRRVGVAEPRSEEHPVVVLWSGSRGMLAAAAGSDPRAVESALDEPIEPRSDDLDRLAQTVGRIPPTTTFALLVDTAWVSPSGAPPGRRFASAALGRHAPHDGAPAEVQIGLEGPIDWFGRLLDPALSALFASRAR